MGSIDWFSQFEKVGSSLRLGMEAQGSEELICCIDLLAGRLTMLPAEQAVTMQQILEEIFAAQTRKDYLLVADLLEYEIAPLLQQLESQRTGE